MKKIYLLLFMVCFAGIVTAQTISATTYPFTTSTGASLTSMASGTTTLVAANSDDGASTVANIGFDFWYVGRRYTQFSANANGNLKFNGTAISTGWTNTIASNTDTPRVSPYWDDIATGTSGKVHYRVTGTTPNRILVVEWLNMTIPRSLGAAGAGTFQCHLYEKTGKIEFIYGSGIATNTTNSGASIGLSRGTTLFASITSSSHTCSYTASNNGNTVAIASGRKYTFTPIMPANPTGITFSSVSTTAMTVNWTPSSPTTGVLGYALYRSTDGGSSYTYVNSYYGATVSTAGSQTGLTSGVTYTWKVVAFSEGGLSDGLIGSQATTSITPCSGTPSAGTAVSTVVNAVGSTSFTLNLTGATTASGLTYQWQSSSCNSSFSNISGATNSTLVRTHSAGTYYRCIVTCSSSGASANSVAAYVGYVSSTYCNLSSTNGCTSNDGVNTFTLTGACGTSISDVNMGCIGTLVDRTSTVVKLYPGSTFSGTINSNFSSLQNGYVWIDLNDNGLFDASELLWSGSAALNPSVTAVSVPVPSTAAYGTHRMRVMVIYSTTTTTGCPTATYGSQVDYTVQIVPNVSITSNSPVCTPGSSLLLTASPAASCGAIYSWSGPSSYSAVVANVNTVSPTSGTGTYSVTMTVNGVSSCPSPGTASVSVNSSPSAITGNAPVCQGSSITLASSPGTGVWSSSNAAIATVSSSGVLTGAGPGTAVVTYTLPSGCYVTTVVTVNSSPAAITGNTGAICPSVTLDLENVSGTGTWSSSASSVAAVGSATGIVSGVSGGTATISFTLGSTGCSSHTVVTVHATPAVISGTLSVCPLLTTTLANSSGSGTWSSSNAAIADVSTSTGVVTGVASGTATITFTLAATGCVRTAVVTVNAAPAPITGDFSACISETATVACATTGGTWTTSNPAVLEVIDGVVFNGAVGSYTISYTVAGCPSIATFIVNGSPNPTITGTKEFCTGTTTTLANSGGVGSWTSSNPTVAIAGATTGIITGATAGTATISYSNGCGTPASTVVTVNQTPAAITGTSSLCLGSAYAFTNGTPGGTWSSSNTSVATITSAGVVSAVGTGTANITYTFSNGCADALMTVTVHASPAAITGATVICSGASGTLANTATGGAWESSNTAAVTVGSATGVITGIAQGTASITYSNGCGEAAVTTISVNAAPAAIGGSSVACLSATTTLSNTSTGGTWSSSNAAIAAIASATGVVTGVATGTAVITYANGCSPAATLVVTVSSSSGTITGTASMCQGATTVLSSSPAGGAWSSSDVAIATVSSSGTVTGINNGTAIITYSSGCGAPSTRIVTVNTYVSCASYCSASNTSGCSSDYISNITFAGINNTSTCTGTSAPTLYTSPMASVAQGNSYGLTMSVNNGGTEHGAVWIDYNHNGTFETTEFTFMGTGSGFTATQTITIPATAIPGVTRMRARSRWSTTITSADACTTFSWGEAEDYYVNISCNTPAITGTASACVGGVTTLSNSTSGGTWTSNSSAIVTVGSATGIVTGVSAGTAVITYRVTATGCFATRIVTVTQPAAIAGTTSVCIGATTTLTNSSGSGTWSTGAPGVASVSTSGGVVTGISAGTAIITFTLGSTGCYSTAVVTVNPLPANITGTLSTCVGLNTTLSNSSGAGTWSSSNTAIATAATGGVVTGVSAGSATITFTLASTGCRNTALVAVNNSPAAITGTLSACIAGTSSLSSATTGGTWSSSNPTLATVSSTGVVTAGAVAGSVTISYTAAGCATLANFAVNGFPGVITGTASVCAGNTTSLFNSGGVGSWSSSNIATATVGGTTGIVAGLAAGTTTISYSNGCGTPASAVVTVLATPGAITGTSVSCLGTSVTLTNSEAGGTWTSSNAAVATIAAATGVVTAVSGGTTTISYTLGNGCAAAVRTQTVNTAPGSISGTALICSGASATLSNSVAGGTWSSSSDTIAFVTSGGVVTGLSQGTAVISYSTGCGTPATVVATVMVAPSAISGTLSGCVGSVTTLSNAGMGGTWSSSNTAVATVGSLSGAVTGIALGTALISYSNGCGSAATAVVTIGSGPSGLTASPSSAVVCLGGSSTFTASATYAALLVDQNFNSGMTGSAGGTWTITNTSGTTTSYWQIRTSPGYASIAGDGTPMMLAAPDATGSGVTTSTIVRSPAFSTVGYSAATLTFNQYCFSSTTYDATVAIEYSTNGGSSWSTLSSQLGSTVGGTTWTAATPTTTLTLPSAAIGQPSVMLRWNYVSTWGYYWAIDNVKVQASSTPTYTWTGAGGLSCTECASAVITPTAAGTNVYSVTATAGGCSTATTVTVTVNPLPEPITGTTAVCVGTTATLATASSGGVWSSSNAAVASVDASTGALSGVSAGTASVTYTLPTGCQRSTVVTVNPLPAAVTGTFTLCEGATTTLSTTTSGGSWSSSNSAIASVAASGVVTGLSSGGATISYTTAAGCYRTTSVTVDPVPAAITGALSVCAGSSTSLSSATPGGSWSGSSSVATVDVSGHVTGVSAGTATISYSATSGCRTTAVVTVNAVPAAITGTTSICEGTSATLSSATGGGTWSGGAGVFTVSTDSSGGVITGITAGSATVSYTLGTGCYTTAAIVVNEQPATITGVSVVCVDGQTTLSTTTSGGSWFSGSTSIATVGASSGVVTGVSGGTAVISYISAAGCIVTRVVTVNNLPSAIAGDAAVCEGSSTTLTSSGTGGTWSSSNISVATVSSAGIVAGIGAGTTTITYALPTGCYTARVLSVNVLPASITGTAVVCSGASTTLSNTTSGGSWASSNSEVATVSASGIVTGVAAAASSVQTATITYTLGTGCYTTALVTVNPIPAVAAIANRQVCNGAATAPIAFSGPVSGTTYYWTTDNPSVGLTAGSGDTLPSFTAINIGITPVAATVTVTPLANGCYGSAANFTFTVKPSPTVASVSDQSLCNGAATAAVTFTGSVSGTTYSWTNSNTGIGLAASGTGSISSFTATNSGTTPQVATITVTPSANSCAGSSTSFTITVNPTPSVATVSDQVLCNGAATAAVTFTGSVSGTTYSWTNSNTGIGLAASGTGSISSFTATNSGTTPQVATITVTPSANSCAGSSTSFTITVNPTPSVATPSDQVLCNGAATTAVTFTGSVSGTTYSWANSNTGIGLAASGTGSISSFTATNSGTTQQVATITVTPSANSCAGSSTSFTITVNPTPSVATVSDQVLCNGAATAAVTFTGSVSGTTYSWTNSNTGIGLAASGTGSISSFTATNSGTTPQVATITVTPSANSCAGSSTSFTITVNPTPSVATVSDQVLCNGAATAAVTFTGSVSGTTYSWTNSNTGIGLAASGTGSISSFTATNSGTTPQVATITVTPSANGCAGSSTSFTITVNPTPSVATVFDQVLCNGAATTAVTFSGSVSGTTYSWTNSNTGIGLAASGTGSISSFTATNSGTTPQVATITVTPSANSCAGSSTSFTITVNPTPSVATVSDQVLCNGAATATVTFSGSVSGTTYSWTNSNTGIGLAASGTGSISSFTATNSGTTPQVATITVTPSANGCAGSLTSFTITINPTPSVASVSDQVLCNGAATAAVTFTGSVSGTTYSWTNSNTGIGLAASGTGSISSFTATNSGTTPQVATITVTPSANSCAGSSTSFTITVNPTPSVATVSNQVLCNGAATAAVTFTGSVSGTTYSWTNSNTGIGLAASGTGSISSFTATNSGTTPQVATITVTPSANSCAGSSTSFTITVNPTPSVATVSNQVLCNGAATAAVTFSGSVSGTTYSWTNSNTGIGLAASGTGSISSFTATNSGTTPQVATITVTPSANSCAGSSTSFTITVNPTPSVATVSNQVLCNGAATAAVTFTGSVSGTTYSWTNSNTGIGLAASGTGSISSFTATNSGTTPQVATITVTPSANSCAGSSTSFTITVNPTPSVATVSNQVLCNGAATAAVTFSGSVSGTTYSWTNSHTGIGLAASGTGSISSFTATNSGTTPQVATITVTPSANSCAGSSTSFTITVNPTPSVATVSDQVLCNGAATTAVTFTGSVSGTTYSWTNSNTGIGLAASGTGSISSFTATNSGTTPHVATITVTPSANGCTGSSTSFTITVNPLPAGITGILAVCAGSVTTASSATSGGSWSTSTPAVATVTSAGIVNGVASGMANITYTLTTGCLTTATVTVNPLPAGITGPTEVVAGLSISLATATAGGSWSSSSTGVAAISSAGVVSGVAAGTATITYTLATGCIATVVVTVHPAAAAIEGTRVVCVAAVTTLTNASDGGSWSTSDGSIATISATGIVTGVSAGTVSVSYVLPTTALATAIVTVNPLPGSISGAAAVCHGFTTTLGSSTGGGSWSVSSPSVASISGSGIVTAVAPGTTTATYTLPVTGCYVTRIITVNPQPASISGTHTVCPGLTTTLTNASSAGNWSSADASIATVNGGGVVSGVSAGTVHITYTLPTGCNTSSVITVNPLPAAISGSSAICAGTSTTLATATTGGTWSSSNSAVASIGSLSGVVNGLTDGAVTLSYTLATGCYRTRALTVNPVAAIAGTQSICIGTSTTLTNAVPGGTWSSASPSVVSVGAGTGVITGNAFGTATISYVTAAGCSASVIVTVSSLLAGITGSTTLCAGSTSTLANAVAGGTWSSSNTSVATIGSSTGLVTAVGGGTATVTYTAVAGCRVTTMVSVYTQPAVISGSLSRCVGGSSTLSNATTGGYWTTSNAAIAEVDSASGVVSAVSAGIATITYTAGVGCFRTAAFTVNANPAEILGSATVCVGQTTTLSNTTTPAISWTSSNSAIASVTTTGVVYGIASGTAVITYTVGSGCFSTRIVTVNPPATDITGTATLCIGASTTLSSTTPEGTWTSGNTAVATVHLSSGVVTGVAAGTARISYTVSTGCVRTTVVTVGATPSAITGSLSACVGLTATITSPATGGTWASSNTSVATISASRIVTGISPGTATLTFTASTGCFTTAVFTVNPLPMPMYGTATVCVGSTATLFTSSTGGTWSSGSPAVATIGSTGIYTGVAAGTANISYTAGEGCRTTTVITVTPQPAVIGGASSVCEGLAITLTNTTSGGSWSSSNTSVATVSSSGVTTGVAAGTVTISYTTGASCSRTKVVTVNPGAPVITGTTSACAGFTSALSNAVAGGTWTSSAISIAQVGISSGVVTASAAGTATITYTLPTTCRTTAVFTVNALPAAISGTLKACEGLTSTLSNSSAGGTWSSASSAIASVDAGGVVSGVSAGSTYITYMLPTGCIRTGSFTVNPVPAAITGPSSVCVGSTATLGSSTGSGTWTSSNTAVATINSSTRVVTGVSVGTATITCMVSTGCIATTTITVNSVPSAITGTLTLCAGTASSLSNSASGGTWSSSNTAIATVGSSGLVSGLVAGTATISYAVGTGCIATAVTTVLPLPAAITGALQVCAGSSAVVGTTASGGTWSSGDPLIASISTSGLVTGVLEGTALISYTGATGCVRTAAYTVNPVPAAITGATTLCVGASGTLLNATSGGSWTGSGGTVYSGPGGINVITGVSAGTAPISYTLPTGCRVTAIITVNALPSAVTGASYVCQGASVSLTTASTGGTWSADGVLASVDAATGVVTGLSTGTASVTYTIASGCYRTHTLEIRSLPAPLTGTMSICQGGSTLLTSATAGALSWISSNTAVATVNPSGYVAGVSAGTATITYLLGTGCATTAEVTVNPLPAAISGPATGCVGHAITMANAVAGGTWASSNTAVATIDPSTGVLTGAATGQTTITYTLGTGCIRTRFVTINPVPGDISGYAVACVGTTVTLSAGSGTWSSSNAAIAAVGSVGGVVTGVAPGTATITFTINTGCFSTTVVTVNPALSTIGGATVLCLGNSGTLTNAVTGGSWSISNTAVATVGSASGIISSVGAGTAIVTYAFGTGCRTTAVITVSTLPAAITGPSAVCQGLTITQSSATTGGSWSSSDPAVAAIGATSGVVTGIAPGSSVITYTNALGCAVSRTITVNALAANTGTAAVCVGFTTTLANANSGGTWSSSNTAVAAVGATGIISGLAAGTTAISYVLPSGCTAVTIVTVIPLPGAITGSLAVCEGGTTTLGNTSAGGTWSTASASVAAASAATGIISGISAGTTHVTYTMASGCYTTAVITVQPLPAAITGTATVCEGGAVTTLSTATSGGDWISGNTTVASVNASGIVAGLSAGTAAISYVLPTGCFVTRIVTVNAIPAAITGVGSVCAGATTTLANATAGGTWSSSDAGRATITGAGVVTGISAGTVTISYTTGTGCSTTTVVTVNALPTAITGPASVCLGAAITVSNATAGGAWASGDATVAEIDASGIISGLSVGTAGISYTITATGCATGITVTVNALPAAISGTLIVCEGSSTTLSNTTTGGTWSSSNTSVATIASTGIVSAVSVGTSAITYAAASGCFVTVVVSVNPLPGVISGAATLCAGTTATFTNPTSGGEWTSSNASVATVGSANGLVTAVAAGNATITYTAGANCSVTKMLTVNAAAPVTGAAGVCVGATVTLANAITGGTWSSSNDAVAAVSATGVVTGMAAGAATISYTQANGCVNTASIAVSTVPAAITGSLSVCSGSSATLANAVPGGIWSSSNTAVATIGSSTGIVSSVAAGTTTITYELGAGCRATAVFQVLAAPGAIPGSLVTCTGATYTISGMSGGSWSTSNPSVASISMNVVTGVSAGTSVLTYTRSTGCYTTAVFTVLALPAPITGGLAVCPGTSSTLTTADAGGTWSSGNVAKVTIGSSSGVITGVATGVSPITYTAASGCFTTAVASVNTMPLLITGSLVACEGGTATLSNATAGGTWSSSNLSVATVTPANGIVTGINAGTAEISYTTAGGCSRTAVVTINALPAAITGTAVACIGATTTLASATAGGTWSTSAGMTMSVGAATGVVTGVAAGTGVVHYTVATGCRTSVTVTVSPLPSAISGPASVCTGSAITLSSATAGGSWSSAAPALASVGAASGEVTGNLAGTTTISYTSALGCSATKVITINPVPAAISGVLTLCAGSTTALSSATTPGLSWTSSNTAVAVVSSTGTVTGMAAGTATVSYNLSTGCRTTAVVTVNPLPAAITGTLRACIGMATLLNSADAGGTWATASTAIATAAPATGFITGVSAGVTAVTYTLPTGCQRSASLTVNALPAAITGYKMACAGTATTLSAVGSGTWSGSNASVATVGSGNGIVTGIAAGTATITFTLSATGCYITDVVTVNVLPANTGTAVVCSGSSTTLSNALPGGVWSSPNVAVATVSATGVVTGMSSPGAIAISYSFGTGCRAVTTVTVHALPAAITGSLNVCQGLSTALSNTTAGGTWSSTNAAVATIGATGVVTGVSGGTATISYTRTTTGCARTTVVTVSPSPVAGTISSSGGFNINTASAPTSVTLTASGTPGGAWTSGNTAVATVDAGGVVTAVGAGAAAISYTVTNSCGAASAIATITVTAARQGSAAGSALVADLHIYPNPNKGTFTIKGNTAAGTDETVNLEVTDMLGQVVYRAAEQVHSGVLEATIQITGSLANGMYMLNMRSATTQQVFHFVVEQ